MFKMFMVPKEYYGYKKRRATILLVFYLGYRQVTIIAYK